MCIGTWTWGERFVWGYGNGYGEENLRQVFDASLQAGLCFFDTAEVYGLGCSEEILGKFIHEGSHSEPVLVASKFSPYVRFTSAEFRWALQNSLRRLRLKQLDLYQIHAQFSKSGVNRWVNALADAYEEGLIRAIGISNFSIEGLMQTLDILERRGLSLASVQMHYSLLNREVELNGMLQKCRELGITFLSYMTLAQGLLTGKYTPQNRPSGLRRWTVSTQTLAEIQPLIKVLGELGEKYGGKTPAQIAINWTIAKGTIPIIGLKTLAQFQNNLGALGWQLSEEDVAMLDELTAEQYRKVARTWWKS